jgi:hypothetical protein
VVNINKLYNKLYKYRFYVSWWIINGVMWFHDVVRISDYRPIATNGKTIRRNLELRGLGQIEAVTWHLFQMNEAFT